MLGRVDGERRMARSQVPPCPTSVRSVRIPFSPLRTTPDVTCGGGVPSYLMKTAETDGKNDMRVFVTGATGVLGRRILPVLRAAGHEVTAVSRSKHEQVRADGGRPVDVDLFDPGAVKTAIDGHDAVLDMATRIPATNRMVLPWAWRDNDRLRSEAASNVADAAIAIGARYVRESFALLYVDADDRWVSEDDPVEPVRYTQSALDAEAAAERVTSAGGIGIALRFALWYGADSPQTHDQLEIARKGLAPVLGDPDGFLPHLHLDDAAGAVAAALDAPAGIYNVVEDQPLRRRELIDVLEDISGRELRTPPGFLASFGPAKAVARSVRLNNAKFRAATSWTPTYASAREGLPVVADEIAGRSHA